MNSFIMAAKNSRDLENIWSKRHYSTYTEAIIINKSQWQRHSAAPSRETLNMSMQD